MKYGRVLLFLSCDVRWLMRRKQSRKGRPRDGEWNLEADPDVNAGNSLAKERIEWKRIIPQHSAGPICGINAEYIAHYITILRVEVLRIASGNIRKSVTENRRLVRVDSV